MTKMGLGNILGIFFTSSSGHPGCGGQVLSYPNGILKAIDILLFGRHFFLLRFLSKKSYGEKIHNVCPRTEYWVFDVCANHAMAMWSSLRRLELWVVKSNPDKV
jgi:hypothetical protein